MIHQPARQGRISGKHKAQKQKKRSTDARRTRLLPFANAEDRPVMPKPSRYMVCTPEVWLTVDKAATGLNSSTRPYGGHTRELVAPKPC